MNFLSSFRRRNFLKTGGAALMIGTLGLAQSRATAQEIEQGTPQEPTKKFQTAGFFRFSLGAFTVTIVSDGYLTLPTSAIATNIPEAQVKAFLKSYIRDVEQHFSHTNLCLIDTGKERILIDAGSGSKFQSSAGRVLQNLEASGYMAEDIDSVVLTHAHPDHAWGIIDDKTGKPRFPNASYYINATEWDYWTQDDLAGKLPQDMQSMAETTQNNLLPIAAQTKRIKPGDEIAPGIEALDTSGHTPGHISLQVSSEKQAMIVSGDVIMHSYVSFEQPDWHFRFDMDAEKAAQVRKQILDRCATDELVLVGFHLPFPGVGYVAKKGKSYNWLPQVWRWDL